MARRRLIWHIGLAHAPRPVIAASLAAHAPALEAAGARVVASPEQADLATHELLRTHRAAGRSRDEVEGQWARIADRVWGHKGVSLLSTPDLCAADKDQLRLALDALIGVEVHLVVTVEPWSRQLYGGWLAELRTGRSTAWEKYVGRVLERGTQGAAGHRQAEEFWAGHELASILARWGWTFHADRLHVVAGAGPARQWSSFLEIAGITGRAPRRRTAACRPRRRRRAPQGEPRARDTAGPGDDRAAGGAATTNEAPFPSSTPRRCSRCSSAGRTPSRRRGTTCTVTSQDLVDDAEPTSLPGAHDQLDAAVNALADALVENDRLRAEVVGLERENQRLDRKRRKHKRRARQLEAVVEN